MILQLYSRATVLGGGDRSARLQEMYMKLTGVSVLTCGVKRDIWVLKFESILFLQSSLYHEDVRQGKATPYQHEKMNGNAEKGSQNTPLDLALPCVTVSCEARVFALIFYATSIL